MPTFKRTKVGGCQVGFAILPSVIIRICNPLYIHRFWQEGNDAQGIYLNDYFEQKLNYIHENPVKAELVNRAEDYRYSSAIDYAGGIGLLKVEVV